MEMKMTIDEREYIHPLALVVLDNSYATSGSLIWSLHTKPLLSEKARAILGAVEAAMRICDDCEALAASTPSSPTVCSLEGDEGCPICSIRRAYLGTTAATTTARKEGT